MSRPLLHLEKTISPQQMRQNPTNTTLLFFIVVSVTSTMVAGHPRSTLLFLEVWAPGFVEAVIAYWSDRSISLSLLCGVFCGSRSLFFCGHLPEFVMPSGPHHEASHEAAPVTSTSRTRFGNNRSSYYPFPQSVVYFLAQ
jgi:hypothetical protein